MRYFGIRRVWLDERCPACRFKKHAGESLCRKCFRRLPATLKVAISQPLGCEIHTRAHINSLIYLREVGNA